MDISNEQREPARAQSLPLPYLIAFAIGLGLVAAGGWLAIAQDLLPRAPRAAAIFPPDPIVPPRALGEFRLVERSGRIVTRGDLADRIVVVHLLFTGCSSGCAMLGDRVAEIQRLTAGAPDVRLVSITVDPRTDTPAVLTRHADRLGADPARWLFLTGEKPEIRRLVESSFLPDAGRAFAAGEMPDTSRLFLVDRSGQVRASFDGLRSRLPASVAAAIDAMRKGDPR